MSDADLKQLPLLDEEIIVELREVMEEEFADLLLKFLNDLPVPARLGCRRPSIGAMSTGSTRSRTNSNRVAAALAR
jgi:hypothetical protein